VRTGVDKMDKTASKKRKAYTVKDKLYAIDRVAKGETKTKVARDIGAPKSTLRRWIKEETKLRNMVSECDTKEGLLRKSSKTANDVHLDKALYTWFVQQRAEGVPVSGTIMKFQAEKFSNDLNGTTEFKASQGWLSRFKARHGIGAVNISGEMRSADRAACDTYHIELKELIDTEGLLPEQIYNCDETGLCHKMMPNKTLASKTDAQRKLGFKQCKDRVTILLTVNKTGEHKLMPLCLGKSKKPRCFHHVNMGLLPMLYGSSANAWMTGWLFQDWFHKQFVPEVRKYLRRKGIEERAILLMDHCPAHPSVENLTSKNGKIRAVFLPKNTTSVLQPCDQGIIRTFKANYRRELVKAILASGKGVVAFLKTLNLKDVFYLCGSAWADVTASIIEHCWMKSLGLAFPDTLTDEANAGEADVENDDFEGFTPEDVTEAQALADELNFGDLAGVVRAWVGIDTECPTHEAVSDADIVHAIQGTSSVPDEDSDSSDVDDVEPPPSARAAVSALECGLKYLETQGSDPVQVLQLRSILFSVRRAERNGCKQTKISSYFVNN
jgi:hypothetical protein